MSVVFVGDIGAEIILDCGTAVTTSTVRNILARSPRGVKKTWAAAVDGTNSIKYVTQAGDLDQSGDWLLQAYVELPGWSGHGDVTTLTVKPTL